MSAGRCTVHADAGCVTLDDGDVVEIKGAFNRIGEEVDPEHPDCVLVRAGPRLNGNDVDIVLNATARQKLI